MKSNSKDYEEPIYSFKSGYSGVRPEFYDVNKLDWVKEIERQSPEIITEILDFLKKKDISKVVRNVGWRGIYLNNFSWVKFKMKKELPKTFELMAKLPNNPFSVISILDGNSSIPKHYGDTNTVMRSMLGVEIPSALPECGLRVGNSKKGWKEGEVIVFSECHEHEVWNETQSRRVVLILDVMRDEYIENKNEICAKVLTRQTLFFLDSKLGIASNKLEFLSPIFDFGWRLYLPVHNYLKLSIGLFS